MNLKEWRKSKGYSLKEVASMFDRASASTIHYWEKNGIDSNRIQTDLKRISLGKITNFEGRNK